MGEEKFWKESYDEGLDDIDPQMWESSFVEIIKPIFDEFADKPALAYLGTEVSFAELDRFSNRFANMLIADGFKKGDVVGISLPNIPEYVIAWLGTLKAGCAVSGVSPLLSSEEMEYQLGDSNVKGLVVLDVFFADKLVNIAPNLLELKFVVAASLEEFMPTKKTTKSGLPPLTGKTVYSFGDVIKTEKFSAETPRVEITPDDIAYIQYTGGTTGTPKGAMLSHRNAVAELLITHTWMQREREGGAALSGYPFFHIAGLAFNGKCIYRGLTQVLIPNPRDTEHICTELARYKPRILSNVPSLYQLLMANPKFRALDHSNIETCVSGAAPFPEKAQGELESIIGEGKLLEVYGMTETSPVATMNPAKGKKKLGSVGLPLLNTEIKLIDPETGKEVARGEPGEVCIKGPQVMVGYYNKPEETKRAIDEEGYLHTGDIAVQDEEGYLRIVDRIKDMINVSGFKVYSKKVEEVLAGHPAIEMIAYIGVTNPDRPGSEIVKAFITIKPSYEFDGDEEALREDIIRFAKEKLAPYEVPKIIEFRKELPLTRVGKIDKKQLRKEAQQELI
ncbi:MAG: AMP-binding protein [Deltaproteobacteria bacterium]|nr:MAG: AMP-binding protein [Deltaproteobacteria bacterium]